jgi:hypothetical protein
MTVKELITILEQFDESSLVVVDGYEGGVTKEFEIIKSKITLNVNKEWYYGESEIDTDGEVEVVYVSRERLTEHREF